MRARPAAFLVTAALVAIPGLAACGAAERPTPTVASVPAPVAAGPVLDAETFHARGNAACATLYSRIGDLGEPPTSDIAAARAWYPKVAAAWHAHLDAMGALAPPGEYAATWPKIIEGYRTIAQAADENAALTRSGREAIEVINSDATARQQVTGAELIDRLRAVGLTTCAGG